MTDHPVSPEPRTEAGKRLDLAWPGTHLDRLDWQKAILAIESEARTAALGEVEEAVKHQLSRRGLDDETIGASPFEAGFIRASTDLLAAIASLRGEK